MKQMLKLGLILMAYTAVACVGLAFVNNATAPAIIANEKAQLNAGLKTVFQSADSFEQLNDFTTGAKNGVTLEALYAAKKGDAVVGYVVKATGATYDKATILAGIDTNGKMTAIQFLALSDTPGFGQKATEPKFSDQFKGKSITDNFEAKADIQAISGATITSKGVSKILKTAVNAVAEYQTKQEIK